MFVITFPEYLPRGIHQSRDNFYLIFSTMNARKYLLLSIVLLLLPGLNKGRAQAAPDVTVTAYFFGRSADVDSIAAEKVTHIIFSFLHLKETMVPSGS